MGVLFLTPNWCAPSEVWISRQIEALEPHVVAIGACDPRESLWRGRIPAIRVAPAPAPLWRRAARRAGLPLTSEPTTAVQVVAEAVADPSVSVVLVHYIDFALRFGSVWSDTPKPVFVHPHGYDTEWDYRRKDRPDQLYFPPGYADTVRRLSERVTMIANSRVVRDRLLAIGVPSERIILQYYGIPAPNRCPRRPARTAGLEILYLGRLVDCKGPDLTIRAFELACERGLDARLTLAGDGHLRTTCELMRCRSRYSARIRLIGAVDAQTADRLRTKADIFTAHNCTGSLTHQTESFGVAVVEAMASGLPVVTGRSGGVCETVRDGETGVLIAPGDVQAHAEALLRLARNPELRQSMGRAGHARIIEHFSGARRWPELRRHLGLEEPRWLPVEERADATKPVARGRHGQARQRRACPCYLPDGTGGPSARPRHP